MKRNTQNSVYNTPGDTKSGQFQLDGTAENAATFVKRFYAEVGGSKDNGFDSYINMNGPVRNDTLAGFSALGLGKIILIALDGLHGHLAKATDKDAEVVLNSIRAYDKIAAEQAELRKKDAARANLAALAADAGVPLDQVEAFLGLTKSEAKPVPAADSIVESQSIAADEVGSVDAVLTEVA